MRLSWSALLAALLLAGLVATETRAAVVAIDFGSEWMKVGAGARLFTFSSPPPFK